MKLHSREIPAQRFAAQFGMGFFELVGGERDFAVLFAVLNRLTACVIASMVDGSPPIAWPADGDPQKYAFQAGQILSRIQSEGQLTYGELLRSLQDIQSSLIRNLIRAERHPDNPERLGGLAG